MSNSDPLASLVVNQQEADRALLASVLAPYVMLDPTRAAFSFRRGTREPLTNMHIAVIALLANKALKLLEADIEEPLSPSDLSQVTGIKGNSLRPVLKRLTDEGTIQRNEDGVYFVPNYGLADVAVLLPGNEEDE